MKILEAKSVYASQGKSWTPALEKRYNAALLKEKKDMFADFAIPFPAEIEAKFNAYVAKGKANPEVYLDNLCHTHIQYALDHYAEILYKKLIEECESETIYERELRKIVGKYGIRELVKAGYIKIHKSYRGNILYAI